MIAVASPLQFKACVLLERQAAMFITAQSPLLIEPPKHQTAGFQGVLASELRYLSPYAVGRSGAAPPDAEPVDMDRLLEMVNHEPAQLREIVQMYLAESDRVMLELRASVQAGDWGETERLAHRLGGTSATCGMIGLVRPLRELEMTAGEGRWSKNQALLLEAARQLARVSAALAGYGLSVA